MMKKSIAVLIVVTGLNCLQTSSEARTLDSNMLRRQTVPKISDYTNVRVNNSTTDPGSGYWEYDPLDWDLGWERVDRLLSSSEIARRGVTPMGHTNPQGTRFAQGDQLEIVAPHFDYRRAIDHAIEFQQNGNELQLDFFRISPGITTLDYRIPEDLPKQYVHPIEQLAPGVYTVTARSFDIGWDFSDLPYGESFDREAARDIDFEAFLRNPFCDLPDGRTLEIVEQTFTFQVVPEPGSLAIALIGLLCCQPLRNRTRRVRFGQVRA